MAQQRRWAYYYMKILHLLIKESKAFFDAILSSLPGNTGIYLRYIAYKRRFKSCGENISISQAVSFKGWANIELGNNVGFGELNSIYAESMTNESTIRIGNDVSFNRNVMINADVRGIIIIEDKVLVGPNVVMRASGHRYEERSVPIREQGHHKGIIMIKTGAWIGANSVILPDVTIGKGAIVAAGAIVTKDVNEFKIVGGLPAREIGSRI